MQVASILAILIGGKEVGIDKVHLRKKRIVLEPFGKYVEAAPIDLATRRRLRAAEKKRDWTPKESAQQQVECAVECARACADDYGKDPTDDMHSKIIELLVGLMHLSDAEKLKWDEMYGIAHVGYQSDKRTAEKEV